MDKLPLSEEQLDEILPLLNELELAAGSLVTWLSDPRCGPITVDSIRELGELARKIEEICIPPGEVDAGPAH